MKRIIIMLAVALTGLPLATVSTAHAELRLTCAEYNERYRKPLSRCESMMAQEEVALTCAEVDDLWFIRGNHTEELLPAIRSARNECKEDRRVAREAAMERERQRMEDEDREWEELQRQAAEEREKWIQRGN